MPRPPNIREPIPHKYSLPQAKKEKPVSLLNSVATGQGTDNVTSIEDVLGSRFDDHIDGDNGSNGLRAFHGDDTLINRGGVGSALRGARGDDTLKGSADADEVFGGPGDNDLLGRGGDDHLRASQGDDFLIGNHGDDTLIGGPGNDTLNGGDASDPCNGETETNCDL